nr:MAG TPA: hypothetical protein [Caudoviricetes sp.]
MFGRLMDVRVKAASADFGLASSWLPVQPIIPHLG